MFVYHDVFRRPPRDGFEFNSCTATKNIQHESETTNEGKILRYRDHEANKVVYWYDFQIGTEYILMYTSSCTRKY